MLDRTRVFMGVISWFINIYKPIYVTGGPHPYPNIIQYQLMEPPDPMGVA